MNVYIDFLDCKNNFKKTRKYFEKYDDAIDFMRLTFDKVNLDFINYTNI